MGKFRKSFLFGPSGILMYLLYGAYSNNFVEKFATSIFILTLIISVSIFFILVRMVQASGSKLVLWALICLPPAFLALAGLLSADHPSDLRGHILLSISVFQGIPVGILILKMLGQPIL